MPTIAPDSTDATMDESSPPRMAGNKRAASSSPAITSPGQGTTHSLAPLDAGADDCETELRPSRLEDKFEAHPKKKTPSVLDSLEKDQDVIDFTDQKAFEELISEPQPPTPGECLPYYFDDEDEYTKQHIYGLNAIKLEECMRQKVIRCKQQDRSQAHPKWNPFRLQPIPDSSDIEIVNCRGKKALFFKPDDFSLNTGHLSFNLEDTATYTLLCYAGPKAISLQIATARRRSQLAATDTGPFRLSRHSDNGRMIDILNEDGIFHTFDILETPRPTDEEWIPVGQQGSTSLKHRVSFCPKSKQKQDEPTPTGNRYGVLSEVDGSQHRSSKKDSSSKLPSDKTSVVQKSNSRRPKANGRNTRSKTNDGGSHEDSSQDEEDVGNEGEEDEDMADTTDGDGLDEKKMEDTEESDDPDESLEVPREPVTIHITPHTPEWYEEESDGEAARSGDEKSPPKLNLNDVTHTPSIATTSSNTSFSSLSHTTDPSRLLDPNSGQHLLSVEIQLQPNKEHLTVLLEETKRLLDYVQELDPTAKFISKDLDVNNKPHPDLVSSKDEHWPKNFVNAQHWFQVPAGFVFSQPPITEKQLQTRLETRYNRYRSGKDNKRRKSKREDDAVDKGPTSVYATINLFSSIPKISVIIDSMNIDLRRYNVRVSLKPLQCWESESRKMLCGIQNGLCVEGVKQLLLHRLKEMEKKLCRHGKLDTLEWYDTPLPKVNVTTRTIRELKLPDNKDEIAQLTFDDFPRSSKFAYFLEASDAAWSRLDPLLSMMVETNDLANTFGPSAFILNVPGSQVNMDRTRAHHKHGRIHMGYNIASTIIECGEVQLYDYEVKVKMEEILTPSGESLRPKPPYAKTTLRKELQRIRFNNEQLFHTAVMVCRGPETGISSVVVAYDPHDPLYRDKYEFAKRTVANLACFMHHWLKQCGYCESTRTRLMCSFYLEKAQLASQSSWDPTTLTATSHFAAKADTYLQDNAHYDPYLRKQMLAGKEHKNTFVDMSDTVRKRLLKELGYDPAVKASDIGSKVSGASALTGDGDTVGASTVNSEGTQNRVLKTKEYAKQLADTKARNAEQAAEINELKMQMQQLTQMLAGINQLVPPHLSGSGDTRPQDEGGGVAPQGA